MKIKNIYLALKDQMPLKRMFRNFFISGNAWGIFHKNSHVNQSNGKLKVTYNTRATAVKSAEAMPKKHDGYFAVYKCIYCDGYHIGKSRKPRRL